MRHHTVFDFDHAPQVAVRDLRALAARHGVALGKVSPVDAAAAVVAADAWMAATGALSFDGAGVDYDVLAAALHRAAGGAAPSGEPVGYVPAVDDHAEAAEAWGRWCRRHLGPTDGADALRRASRDISLAQATPALAGLAELLGDIADCIDEL